MSSSRAAKRLVTGAGIITAALVVPAVPAAAHRLPKPMKTDDAEVTEAVTAISWSGGKIQPGRFQQFWISIGPLPKNAAKLYFKALQTYTDRAGKTSVVRWIDLPGGGAEPDHPAPSLTLAKATLPQATVKKSGGAGIALGAAGLVAGLLALAIAIVALRRSGGSART
jgi:hypothetical protein